MLMILAAALGSGLQLFLWLTNFVVGVCGLFISLYMLITHDDMQQHRIEPAELADNLQWFLPVEYTLSFVYVAICIL